MFFGLKDLYYAKYVKYCHTTNCRLSAERERAVSACLFTIFTLRAVQAQLTIQLFLVLLFVTKVAKVGGSFGLFSPVGQVFILNRSIFLPIMLATGHNNSAMTRDFLSKHFLFDRPLCNNFISCLINYLS